MLYLTVQICILSNKFAAQLVLDMCAGLLVSLSRSPYSKRRAALALTRTRSIATKLTGDLHAVYRIIGSNHRSDGDGASRRARHSQRYRRDQGAHADRQAARGNRLWADTVGALYAQGCGGERGLPRRHHRPEQCACPEDRRAARIRALSRL